MTACNIHPNKIPNTINNKIYISFFIDIFIITFAFIYFTIVYQKAHFLKKKQAIKPVSLFFAGAEGIEPPPSVLETEILPLN